MEWMGCMEWNGMEWNGMGWDGMEWDGMEWDGMEATIIHSTTALDLAPALERTTVTIGLIEEDSSRSKTKPQFSSPNKWRWNHTK